MKIKLFGKNLFEVSKGKGEALFQLAQGERKDSKFLPDFLNSRNSGSFESFSELYVNETGVLTKLEAKKKKAKKPEVKVELTPKGVFQLKMLDCETFSLNTDPEYVDKQLEDFKDKLSLIKSEEYDMSNGVQEISSIITRLENRKKYQEVKDFFEQYPYTTTVRINDLVKNHSHLKLGQVAQFLADMPNEATQVMKQYNNYTNKVCGKQAVFYIIADKKDFQKSDKRRDPILLAQSPFGHFWQILGAWDEEMLLLENL